MQERKISDLSKMKKFLMGNEAIAWGAVHAGVNVVAGYPGTPSTEVLETVAKNNDGSVYVEWSVNEKAALEVAAGASYAGARTLVTMKQVGLNVASDPLMSLAYVGVKGGMVILSADDPGPMGKPGTIYTDPTDESKRGWDPTDPDSANPWDAAFRSGTAIRSEAAWNEWNDAQNDGRWNGSINPTDLQGWSTDSSVEGTRG